jgi:rhamnosyltransferase
VNIAGQHTMSDANVSRKSSVSMVAAVVVLYHPKLLLLDRLLQSAVGQVEKLYVIDNSPESSDEGSSYFDKYQSSISYLPLGDNKGIATAQNIGIRKCMADGYSHVLLLDQDSALPPGMVNKLIAVERELLKRGEKVAAVGPIFIDEKTGNYPRVVRLLMQRQRESAQSSGEPIPTGALQASGSLIRCRVFSAVGTMLDELFIDHVDTEWGYRAKERGYKSYLTPDVVLQHSTGDKVIHLFGREIYLHNSIRHYYIVRNSVYLLRSARMGVKWKAIAIIKIPSYVFVYAWHSNHKVNSVMLLSRAILDGFRGKLGRLN